MIRAAHLAVFLALALAAPSLCESRECRGEGVTEVKAADEHCGFVPRERKDAALDAACTLAADIETDLREQAEKQARDACPPRSGERCSAEIRRWENAYTHVLSGKCWTACGWAAVVYCSEDEDGNAANREGKS